jgi:pimeloyl-ACP methyl ester carboxylesterase
LSLSNNATSSGATTMHDAKQATGLERREHRLPPAAGCDAPLSLQELAPVEARARPTPIVLLHGATFASVMFDIQVAGYSMQRFLADRGWRNFALDLRGYGRSVPATILDAPPEANEPYARMTDAADDLAAGVRFALARCGGTAAHIVGFSWGSLVACLFATRHPELTDRLVLYAPLFAEVNEPWIDRIADPRDRSRVNPRLGAYRWIAEPDIRARWEADIPAGARADDYRDVQVLHAIFEALTAADPRGRDRPEPAFRVPTGALVDLFEVFNGRPLFDPQAVVAPTLIVRGRDDTTSTESDAWRLFGALGAARKRYVTIAPGSHFLCAERNAQELFGEIDLFLRQ